MHRLAPILAGAALLLGACASSVTVDVDAGAAPDAAVGSALDAGPGVPTDASVGTAPYAGAWIAAACGPADGPALRLTLWDVPVPDCSHDERRRSLTFYLHGRGVPPAPGETLAEGQATECPGGRPPCRQSSDLSVTFLRFEAGVRAEGSYRVTFPDGDGASGTFTAEWCMVEPPLCG